MVEKFNKDMRAFFELYDEEIYSCGFNPERITAWNALKREMRQARFEVIKYLYKNGIRTAVMDFNRKLEMCGSPYKSEEIFPF